MLAHLKYMPMIWLVIAIVWLFVVLAILGFAMARRKIDNWLGDFKEPNTYGRWFRMVTKNNTRLERILDETMTRAKAKNLHMVRPEILQTKWWVPQLSFYGITYFGITYIEDNVILIHSHCLKTLSDYKLALLVAHEMGHIFHEQSKHNFECIPLLCGKMPAEEFADRVATYVYAEEVYLDLFENSTRLNSHLATHRRI